MVRNEPQQVERTNIPQSNPPPAESFRNKLKRMFSWGKVPEVENVNFETPKK